MTARMALAAVMSSWSMSTVPATPSINTSDAAFNCQTRPSSFEFDDEVRSYCRDVTELARQLRASVVVIVYSDHELQVDFLNELLGAVESGAASPPRGGWPIFRKASSLQPLGSPLRPMVELLQDLCALRSEPECARVGPQ